MSLNILDTLSREGLAGTAGGPGLNGSFGAPDGTPGGNGTAGGSAGWTVRDQIFTGDAGGDSVTLTRIATGGGAGGGGLGGRGAIAQATVVESSGPGFSQTDVTFGAAGIAGSGGLAAAAGQARVTYTGLTFDLGQAAGSQNAVRLVATAGGGQGSAGGSGGTGGSSGGTTESITTSGPPFLSTVYSQQGSAGQAGGDGQTGSSGASGKALFSALAVTGDTVKLDLIGTATGGGGGGGGNGALGGDGDTGGQGGAGGNGGSGGLALARVEGLTVAADLGLQLRITLTATAGGGANGGTGEVGGTGSVNDSNSGIGGNSSLTTITHAAAGAGGNGGSGGVATAMLRDSSILGSAAVDAVYVSLTATGGAGGTGQRGGADTASSSTTVGTSVTNITGAAAGLHGTNGTAGAARVEMSSVEIRLGGGDDLVNLSLRALGPDARPVVFTQNVLNGGSGRDSLVLGSGISGEQAVTVDVFGGTLAFGSGVGNSISGFESFTGTSAADHFIDAAGDQTYAGGLGSDRFDFVDGRGGQDRILGWSGSDVIKLSGFGPALDSFADVQFNTQQTAEGALIDCGGGTTILLAGVNKAAFVADDFAF